MGVKTRQLPAFRPVPWREILTLEERGRRLRDALDKSDKTTTVTYIALELGLSRGLVSRYLRSPSIEFALKLAYLYDFDVIDVYPELIFLRDAWLHEARHHLKLLAKAAETQNYKAVQALTEVMTQGLALYLTPEFQHQLGRINSEGLMVMDIATRGIDRRRRHETHQEARQRNAE